MLTNFTIISFYRNYSDQTRPVYVLLARLIWVLHTAYLRHVSYQISWDKCKWKSKKNMKKKQNCFSPCCRLFCLIIDHLLRGFFKNLFLSLLPTQNTVVLSSLCQFFFLAPTKVTHSYFFFSEVISFLFLAICFSFFVYLSISFIFFF